MPSTLENSISPFDCVITVSNPKFYELPRWQTYQEQKKAYLQTIPGYSDQLTDQRRWRMITTHLQNTIRPDCMPDGITCDEFNSKFSIFISKRLDTINNSFNLSLKQCVGYFEDFLFLHNTDTKDFKISATERIKLLQVILEVSQGVICEMGLNGRFYSILQDLQKDSNWVATELARARCATIRILETAYQAQARNPIPGEVHTYNYIVELANTRHLGIPQTITIEDAHGAAIDKNAVKKYFDENYQSEFTKYEENAINTLTNYYLNELSSIGEIDVKTWQSTGKIDLNASQMTQVIDSINTAFYDSDVTYEEKDFLRVDPDNFEVCTLKSREEVSAQIAIWVRRKLIHQGYFEAIDLKKAMKNPKDYSKIKLNSGHTPQDLINVYQAIVTNDYIKIRRYENVLLSYPEILIAKIKTDPSYIGTLPPFLMVDTRCVDHIVACVDGLLKIAISEKNPTRIKELSSHLMMAIGTQYGYIHKLSSSVLNHPAVASIILEKNPWFFGNLGNEAQQHEDLKNLARSANPQILDDAERDLHGQYHHLLTNYNLKKKLLDEQHRVRFPNEDIGDRKSDTLFKNYDSARSMLLQLTTFHKFLSQDQISIAELHEEIGYLSPGLLHTVIRERSEKGKTPLPLFTDPSKIKALAAFGAELDAKLEPKWYQNPLDIKRQACANEDNRYLRQPYRLKTAVTFLAKTPDWYIGFEQYFRYQTSVEKKFSQFIDGLKAIYTLLFEMIKLSLWISIYVVLLPLLNSLLAPYALPLLGVWLGFFLLNLFVKSTILDKVTKALSYALIAAYIGYSLWILLIRLDTIVLSIYQMCINIYFMLSSLKETLYGLIALISIVSNVFNALKKDPIPKTSSLEEMAEHTVLRLEHTDNHTSQEKGHVLRKILEHIHRDMKNAPEVKPKFDELMKKQYPITYKGKEHHVSFAQVAAMRRPSFGSFRLEAPDMAWRFFKKPTSEIYLTKAEPTLLFGV